ncbi:MAG TPA: site-specific DNA-methyltransferase, partial [Candidatus Cloacimonadota bacterium]|nr:site-specific DNA-methyltransferase [Candidatus Cloacimonadota bacterium]
MTNSDADILKTKTYHKLIIGDSSYIPELKDESMHLIITSPPYFNAPFDYSGVYSDYESYLKIMSKISKELYRVLKNGRIFALNIDDMLVDGVKYPITADFIKLLQSAGFRYRDRIIWKKPDGYLRISKRSGVLLQNPFPMYFYPDNLLESILIFQKGKFDYKQIHKEEKKESLIDIDTFKKEKWFSSLWEITNVLPGSKLE